MEHGWDGDGYGFVTFGKETFQKQQKTPLTIISDFRPTSHMTNDDHTETKNRESRQSFIYVHMGMYVCLYMFIYVCVFIYVHGHMTVILSVGGSTRGH